MSHYNRERDMLNEYSLINGTIREADDQPNDAQQDPQQQTASNTEGTAPTNNPPAASASGNAEPSNEMGNVPANQPMFNDQGNQNNGEATDGGMADGLNLPPDNTGGFDGEIEDVDMDGDPEGGIDIEPMQPEDEVIDVDELTTAQEEASARIDGVDEKLTTLGKVIEKFIDAINQNDSKIEDLKREFEKRNPTQQEKFNIRSQASGPFTQSPRDYWDNVSKTNPNYQVMYNNEVPTKDEQQEFELRKADIDSMDDRSIMSSFDEYPTKLDDILDF